METLEAIQTTNFKKTDDGTIRIGKTRVSLESVVYHFQHGATAEEIQQKFPALTLAEVYSAIAYFLNNRVEVENYLRRQESENDILQTEIEAKYQPQTVELRKRILNRLKNGENF